VRLCNLILRPARSSIALIFVPAGFEGHVMETIFLVPGIAGSRLGLNNLGLNNQEVGLPHPRRCGLATLDHHREADYGLGPL
jgi:hypothetical protein